MSINPGLERITSLLSFFPPLSIPVVHLAGTNGKGSVSAILDSTLSVADLSTGRFNSPHLVSVEDSIRINGQPVSRTRYDRVRADVERVDKEKQTGASLFELLTVTALRIFEGDGAVDGDGKGKVDVLIIECGMGGELDATNVFPADLVLACVLTSVDLDHQGFLGNTPGEIARGKARIVKEGGVLVVGKQSHAEVRGVVEEVVRSRNAEAIWAADSFIGVDIPDDSTGSAVWPFSLHPFVPPPPQPVLTPLPNIPSHPAPSFSTFTDSYTLLRTHLEHHIQTTTPLLDSSSSSTTPASLLPLITSLSALTSHTTSFPSNPHSILLTHLPLPGSHQRDNLSLALTTLHILRSHPVPLSIMPRLTTLLQDDSVLQSGVRQVEWEGRCSWVALPSSSAHLLVDGAHNSASATLLRSYIDSLPLPPTTARTFIISLSHSPPKTPLETLRPLLRAGDRVACVEFSTPIEGMPWVRPVPRAEVGECVEGLGGVVWNGEGGLEEAVRWATEGGEGGLVVVCGSLYLVADLFRLVRKGGE